MRTSSFLLLFVLLALSCNPKNNQSDKVTPTYPITDEETLIVGETNREMSYKDLRLVAGAIERNGTYDIGLDTSIQGGVGTQHYSVMVGDVVEYQTYSIRVIDIYTEGQTIFIALAVSDK